MSGSPENSKKRPNETEEEEEQEWIGPLPSEAVPVKKRKGWYKK